MGMQPEMGAYKDGLRIHLGPLPERGKIVQHALEQPAGQL